MRVGVRASELLQGLVPPRPAARGLLSALAALDAAAELQRDVVQRVGRLEEASTSYRAALGELAPQRLATGEEKLQSLKQALDDNERAARDRGRELGEARRQRADDDAARAAGPASGRSPA